jgi:hypothetical protein
MPFCFSASRTAATPYLGRIEEGGESHQCQVALIGDRVGILPGHVDHGNPNGAITIGTQFLVGCRRLSAPLVVERLGRSVDAHRLADCEDILGLAFRNQKKFFPAAHDNRKALAVEVERNLVHLFVFRDGGAFMLQHRIIHRALDAGLEEAVDEDEPQHAFIIFAQDVHMPVQHDRAFGQRARLIAAQDRQAAEILDRCQLLDQNLLPGHAARALRQRDGDDHRHHLRRHPDSERYREQE